MNSLNPVKVYKLIRNMVREANALVYFMAQTKKILNNDVCKALRLRRNSFGTIYWVINFPPEFLMSSREGNYVLAQTENAYISSQSKELNAILSEAQILDMIRIEKQRVKNADHYASVIIGKFNFSKFTFWNLLFVLFYIAGLSFGIYYGAHYLVSLR